MFVRGRMTRDVVTVTPFTPLPEAVEILRARGIRHLPVVREDRLVGILTDRDICPVIATGGGATAVVADFMTADPLTTAPEAPVEEAARVMAERRVGCLPVLEESALVGIVTQSDLLKALTELLGGREHHSRIEILAPNRPGELARIVRLIGIDHGINISGVVVPPPEGDRARIILHLEKEDVEDVTENLRLLGYVTASPRTGSPA